MIIERNYLFGKFSSRHITQCEQQLFAIEMVGIVYVRIKHDSDRFGFSYFNAPHFMRCQANYSNDSNSHFERIA
jgi:hypothetical protein